jgi:hypothetical protein
VTTVPRIVNAQRMGAKLHVCVEDVRTPNGVWQRCACGGRIVQSDEVAFGDWREDDLTERDFCGRCWTAYRQLKAEGW